MTKAKPQDMSELIERLQLVRGHTYLEDAEGMCAEAAEAVQSLLVENEMLKDHIFDHAEFAEYRIKDGEQLGAAIWRIALEDIAKENRTLLGDS